jgi:hypothetical protein
VIDLRDMRDMRDEHAKGGERDGHVTHVPGWDDLLRAAIRPHGTVFERETAPPPVARRPGGCLVRLLLLMAFLFFAFIAGLSVLGGSVLRLFFPY